MISFRRTATLLCAIFGVLLVEDHLVQGRTWVDVIDTSIYASAMVDPYRDTMSQYGQLEEEEWTMPTAYPTATPTSAPAAEIVDAFSKSPSPAPTQFTCVNTSEVLAMIRMYDSWGDGWGDTTMTIAKTTTSDKKPNATNLFYSYSGVVNLSAYREAHKVVFEDSLIDGYESFTDICLETNVCYSVEVNGTSEYWQDEIKWDIRTVPSDNATAVTLAKGSAPVKCQFSIPDGDNTTLACEYVCEYQDNHDGASQPATSPLQSFEPSDVSSFVPSLSPTLKASDYPSSLKSDVPVDSNTLEPSLLPTSPIGGSANVGTSAQPSLAESMMHTTFIPTITMQPTISAFPTITAFPTVGSVGISVGTPGAEPRSGFFTDDDAPYSHAPSSTSVYPTTPTAMPTEYGQNFMDLSKVSGTTTSAPPSTTVKELSFDADQTSVETLSDEDDTKAQPTPSVVVTAPSSGYAVLSPNQPSSHSSYGSAALSPAQLVPTGERESSYGSAILSPAQLPNASPVRASSYGSAVLSPAQISSRPVEAPPSSLFGSAALPIAATAPVSDSPQYSPTFYMIFGAPASPGSTPVKAQSVAPTSAATTFIPTVTYYPTVPSEAPNVSSTRSQNTRPNFLGDLSRTNRERIREEYKLRHSNNA